MNYDTKSYDVTHQKTLFFYFFVWDSGHGIEWFFHTVLKFRPVD